jgi:hypothetical protein
MQSLHRPIGFQDVEVDVKVVGLSALLTSCIYPHEIFLLEAGLTYATMCPS